MNLELEYTENLIRSLKDISTDLVNYFQDRIDEGSLSKVLDFEFHISSVGRSNPVVCHTAARPLEGVKDIIPGSLFFSEKYQGIEEKVWDITTVKFFTWFQECWLEAGGEEYRGNAYLAMHDDTSSLDLKTGEWISNEQRVDY